jgi:translation elongation factor EF-1beta
LDKLANKDDWDLLHVIWPRYEERVDMIEEQLIRSDGIYFYSKAPIIEASIDRKIQEKVERVRQKMQFEMANFNTEISNIPSSPKLDDFDVIEKYEMEIKNLSIEIHHLVGTHIAFGITGYIYEGIMDQLEEEFNSEYSNEYSNEEEESSEEGFGLDVPRVGRT